MEVGNETDVDPEMAQGTAQETGLLIHMDPEMAMEVDVEMDMGP